MRVVYYRGDRVLRIKTRRSFPTDFLNEEVGGILSANDSPLPGTIDASSAGRAATRSPSDGV